MHPQVLSPVLSCLTLSCSKVQVRQSAHLANTESETHASGTVLWGPVQEGLTPFNLIAWHALSLLFCLGYQQNFTLLDLSRGLLGWTF